MKMYNTCFEQKSRTDLYFTPYQRHSNVTEDLISKYFFMKFTFVFHCQNYEYNSDNKNHRHRGKSVKIRMSKSPCLEAFDAVRCH